MPRQVDRPERRWTLTERPGWRLVALCGLYFTQGLPFGFMFITIASVLADAGHSEGDIGGLLALAMLPWGFKWVLGPVIDRFGLASMGRRRPWILLAQLGLIVSLAALAFGPDPLTHNGWLAWGLLVVSGWSARMRLTRWRWTCFARQSGAVLMDMYGSSYMGNALGGAGMGTVVAVSGLRTGFLVIAVVVAIVMLLPLLLRERRGERLLPWTKGKAASNGQCLQSPC